MNKHKYLTEDELVSLTTVLAKYRDNPRDVRNILLLDLLLATGTRIGELLKLRAGDLNDADTSVFFHGLKGSRDREIPLSLELYTRLKAYSAGKDLIFPLSYNRAREIWAYYRPVQKRLHALRHTFAINLYRRTKDVRLVQRALGHRYLSTTMIYQDYQYSLDELRAALIS